ncbi:hypothetical protein Pla52o_48560 [Novipirellula galeiformis]|uniref:Uncharacterized protein n=1 Tax=Novipirellula galeiformis TaxID=2528004 RepID=A0A5C6C1X5_9BACT|nr:hypothetical protein Pla52o_48560 [Novipirellula galeiformis]
MECLLVTSLTSVASTLKLIVKLVVSQSQWLDQQRVTTSPMMHAIKVITRSRTFEVVLLYFSGKASEVYLAC